MVAVGVVVRVRMINFKRGFRSEGILRGVRGQEVVEVKRSKERSMSQRFHACMRKDVQYSVTAECGCRVYMFVARTSVGTNPAKKMLMPSLTEKGMVTTP